MADRFRYVDRDRPGPRYGPRDDDYSDDEETNIRIQHTRREPQPPPQRGVSYIQVREPERQSRRYYDGPNLVVSEQTMVRARSKSHERRSAPSPPERQGAGANQIVINNYNDHSSSSSSSDNESDRSTDVSRRSRRGGGGRGGFAPGPQMPPPPPHMMNPGFERPMPPPGPPIRETQMELERTRRELQQLRMRDAQIQQEREADMQLARYKDEWEFQQTRRELQDLKTQREREAEERRREKETREEAELRRAKQELDEIKRREEKEAEEERLAREYEIKRLEKEKKAAEEKARREKADKDAVERYKLEMAEKERREREAKAQADKEYQRRLQEDLINSGVDEKHIQAIIKKEKIPEEKPKAKERATYTRMARRHLSIETLNAFRIDFDYDQDPNYILIKRWVPEEEQDQLWKHTRIVRERRTSATTNVNKVVITEQVTGRHRSKSKSKGEDFIFVKKKRERSRSPSLLMYLAGAQPR